ncbi:hypothetical protein, partial [Bacillus tropicus]|uniref:hypothetical protein n=1 Tax=Bacillus tropicus TaxID=2026188 RepID=UPI001C99FA12
YTIKRRHSKGNREKNGILSGNLFYSGSKRLFLYRFRIRKSFFVLFRHIFPSSDAGSFRGSEA